jgi:hypothetical protein
VETVLVSLEKLTLFFWVSWYIIMFCYSIYILYRLYF